MAMPTKLNKDAIGARALAMTAGAYLAGVTSPVEGERKLMTRNHVRDAAHGGMVANEGAILARIMEGVARVTGYACPFTVASQIAADRLSYR